MRDAVAKVMNRTPGFELQKPDGSETKTPEQLAAEKAEADKTAAEKADKELADRAATAGKTVEQLKAEEKAAADAKAGKKEGETETEPNPLDKLGPLPVETLAKVIEENPTLAAELEKAGLDSELLYETARRAALSDQYAEVFPDVDTAKFAATSAQHFYDLEEIFPKISDIKSLDEFITNTMLPLSVLTDPKTGEPLKNADGTYQTDGSIGRFFDATSQMETVMGVRAIEKVIEAAKAQGEAGEDALQQAERIKDALILAQEFRDAGYKIPGKRTAAAQRSPEDQKLIDDARRATDEANRRNAEARETEFNTYVDGAVTESFSAAKTFIKGVLDRTALSDYDKSKIAGAAHTEGWEALETNRHYQAQKEHLLSLAATPENQKQLIALTNRAFQREAQKVLEREIQAAGGKLISRNAEKQKKQETQQANDRMNQGGGTTPTAKGPGVKTAGQLREEAIKNLKAGGNAHPSDGDILLESLRLRKATQAA